MERDIHMQKCVELQTEAARQYSLKVERKRKRITMASNIFSVAALLFAIMVLIMQLLR